MGSIHLKPHIVLEDGELVRLTAFPTAASKGRMALILLGMSILLALVTLALLGSANQLHYYVLIGAAILACLIWLLVLGFVITLLFVHADNATQFEVSKDELRIQSPNLWQMRTRIPRKNIREVKVEILPVFRLARLSILRRFDDPIKVLLATDRDDLNEIRSALRAALKLDQA